MTPTSSDFFDLVVARVQHEASSIAILDLQRADASGLPAWQPGAHIDVRTQDASGKEVVRQYSLCGPQGEDFWRIAVLADTRGRGGSIHLFQTVTQGQKISVRGPRNHFELPNDDRPVVLVAGGIGITPLLAMADRLHEQGRRFRLHYFARSRHSMAFLDQLMSGPYQEQVRMSFDDDHPTPVESIFSHDDSESWLYTCGPEGFMKSIMSAAQAATVSPSRMRKELFTSDAAAAADTAASCNRAFTVVLRSSGKAIEVPADKTVVHALSDAGVDIVVSCEQGHCGSCLTGVLDGIPDHRDQFMLPEEQERNDAFTPCCSRAVSETLVLDL